MTPCTFDVARVPFSTFGSWMSISIPRDEEELYFRNHHNGANDLFPLRTLIDGEPVRPQIAAQPSSLILSYGEGRVEVCFESTRTVRMRGQGLAELWCGDHFVARLGNDGSAVESESLIPFTDWGLATEKVNRPHYRENGYWRGPIWAPSTWLAVAGLDRAGFPELADTVSERFCRMCGKSGFPENFNALTGEPLCDPAYTWTASVFLLLAERLPQREPQGKR